MAKKNILITGGAGFIGSHLCDKLLSEGFKVICMDNLITGSKANIRHLLKNPDFDFIEYDVTGPIRLNMDIFYVLHFASLASPAAYLKFPIHTLNTGSLGTYNALELAGEKKAQFLLASTSEVYGDPLVHPQTEAYWGNVNPLGPRSCYDESKRFAEALTMAYQRVHKIDTKIARIFNTYGQRMSLNDGRVIPNFINQALQNKPFTVYGKGTQTRSFCYISDLIEGIAKLMKSDLNEPVNLGNPGEFTMLELAGLILKITGSKSRIVFKPLPQDDPKQRKPDISRAKKYLKWRPKVNLKQGLIRTIHWFSSCY